MRFSATRLQRILDDDPVEFRLGDYINQGLQFMNQNLGPLVGFLLISIVISIFCSLIPFVGMVANLILAPVLQIGYAQFAFAATRERRVDFGEFFKGFNKTGPLLATYLLTGLVGLLALIPGLLLWYQAGMVAWVAGMIEEYPRTLNMSDLSETVDMTLLWLGILAMLVGSLIISVLFTWSLNVVWFFEVGPMEALNASRKLIARNWPIFVAFMIVTGLIGAIGVLLCGIGLLYTVPAMYCAQFFAFADSARLFEDDGEDQPNLIDHFIA